MDSGGDELPAIAGGTPMFSSGAPAWPGVASPAVNESVNRALADGCWGKYEGIYCRQLSDALKQRFQVEHVLLCSSGTIATEIALRGLTIGSNSEVALAAYDYAGNFRSIEAVNARPVLLEINRDDWCIDTDKLAESLSDETHAVIASHLHGCHADIKAMRTICEPTGVAIVEDACQNPGALIQGDPVGQHSAVATLSFGGSKLLTAGRGGAVLTDDSRIYQRARNFATQGNDAFPFSELQAAALLPQLETLDEQNQRRLENVKLLSTLVPPIWNINLEQQLDRNSRPAWFKLPWLLDADFSASREQVIAALQAEGIAADAGFRGFANRSQRRCRKPVDLRNSSLAASQTIVFHHPILLKSADHIQRLSRAIDKVYRYLESSENLPS